MNHRNKSIRNLVVVFLVLVGVIVGRQYLPQGDDERDAYLSQWDEVDVDQVQGLEVGSGDEVLVVSQESGDWMVGGYLADADNILDLLTNIMKPLKMELVSETAQRHEALGVSESQANALKLSMGGDTTRNIMLGDTTVSGRYVRLEGSDAVYLVDDVLSRHSSVDVNDWIEKTILEASEETVTKVSVSRLGSEISLERRDREWYEVGSETALDRTGFSAMVNTLDAFVTQGLVDEDEEASYGSVADVVVAVEQEDKDPVELQFFAGEDNAMVTSSERSGKYLISTSLMENFELTENDLVAKEMSE